MGIQMRRIDPTEQARKAAVLRETLDRLPFMGGQAQVGNNLENRHLHRGDIKNIGIAQDHLVIAWSDLVRVRDAEALMDRIMGDRCWVEEMITDPAIGWMRPPRELYTIGLATLESIEIAEDDSRVVLKFFFSNETVILIPKGSSFICPLETLCP